MQQKKYESIQISHGYKCEISGYEISLSLPLKLRRHAFYMVKVPTTMEQRHRKTDYLFLYLLYILLL